MYLHSQKSIVDTLSFQLRILFLVICLLSSRPAVLYSHLLHGITCKFLYMKAIYHSSGFWKTMSYYLMHTVGQVQGDLINFFPFLFIYLIQYLSDIQGPGSCNNCYKTSFPAVFVPVSHNRIEFTIGQGGLVHSYVPANIILKEKPLLRMGQLIPGPVTA